MIHVAKQRYTSVIEHIKCVLDLPRPRGPIEERSLLLRRVRWQRLLGRLSFVPFAILMHFALSAWGCYQISNLTEVRRTFRRLARQGNPLIICANHLTYADSAVISWALAPVWWYALHFDKFSWNLPAGDHFARGALKPLIAFFFKCIFLYRDGSKAHKSAVLDTALELLKRGEPLTIFPEGKRSRSGSLDSDNIKYGVGKLIAALEQPTVLCLYVRGHRQSSYSSFPARHSRFRFGISVLHPVLAQDAVHSPVNFTRSVVAELVRLEREHFSHHFAEETLPHGMVDTV